MIQKKLSLESQQYNTQDYKILYRYIKNLNLLNQLYLSQAIDEKEFNQEYNQTLKRYSNIKQQLGDVDFKRFAQLYGIQEQFKRIQHQPKNGIDKKILQIAVQLTGKIVQFFDTTAQETTVLNVRNIFTEIDMLLKNLKKNAKNISPDFIQCMNKISLLRQNLSNKQINQPINQLETLEINGSIQQLKIHFQQFSQI